MSNLRSILFFLIVVAASILSVDLLSAQTDLRSVKKNFATIPPPLPQPKIKPVIKPVTYWIDRLSHQKFSEREHASAQLVQAGVQAIPKLAIRTKSKDIEAALRAVKVLGEICHQAVNQNNSSMFLEAESVLNKISVSKHRIISASATEILENHSETRKNYALKEIKKLGGMITWLENDHAQADFPEAKEQQQIAFILLGRKWKGTDDNLKLFRHLPNLKVVMISGSKKKPPLTEKGIEILKETLPQLTIQFRGTACLGVRGYDRAQMGGAQLPPGCSITFVKSDSAADKAGLLAGDVIVQFGKKKVTNFQMLIDAISEYDPDEKVVTKIERLGVAKSLEITLQEWKP